MTLVIDIVAKKSGPAFGPFEEATNPDGETSVVVEPLVSALGMIVHTIAQQGVLNAADPTTTIPTAKVALALNGLAGIGISTVADLRNAFTDAFNFDPNVIIPLWSNKSTGMQAAGRPDAGIDRGMTTVPPADTDGTYLSCRWRSITISLS